LQAVAVVVGIAADRHQAVDVDIHAAAAAAAAAVVVVPDREAYWPHADSFQEDIALEERVDRAVAGGAIAHSH
jgi:hypothetical protein